jgi:hydrogenase 3 maturation protease
MSNTSWSNSLKKALTKHDQPRVAVVGIGHDLRGDDAAGVEVARALKPLLCSHENVLVVEGGLAPENQTGLLRRFQPDLILLVDAAQMNEAPGTIHWLPWQAVRGLSASTHTLPLSILAQYLTVQLDCEVALLGIQPADTTIGLPLSFVVQQSAARVIKKLVQVLQNEGDVYV